MSSDLDAKLDEMLEGGEAPETDPTPEAQPESEQAAAEIKLAELDAVLPDDPSVPEGYRNKNLADVLRVAEQHKYEAKIAAERNQHWNQMQAERDAARIALDFFQKERQAAQQPQQPTETPEEYLQRLALRPEEAIDERVDSKMRPVLDELRQTREELFRSRADQARLSAMDVLGIPQEVRNEISASVGTFMAANNWPANDPNAWAEATRRYLDSAFRTVQRLTPKQQAEQPPVEVPRPGAPPNGTARSQSRPASTVRLKPAVRGILDDIADAAGLDPKRKANLEKFAADSLGGGN